MSAAEKVATYALSFIIIAGLVAVGTWLWQLVWNFVVAGIFHGPSLTFWQAFVVSVFLSIIGSSFRSNK